MGLPLQSDVALLEYAVGEGDQLTLVNVYNAFLDAGKNAAWCRVRGAVSCWASGARSPTPHALHLCDGTAAG